MKSKWLQVALAVLLILAAVEAVSRLFFEKSASDQLERHANPYFPNAFGFRDLKPGPRWILASDRTSKFHVNSLGYRADIEILPKVEGELRIVVLGGSFVFDIFSNQGNEWTRKLEANLRRDFPNVSVWNRGVPGATSALALMRTVTELALLRPDIVIYTGVWNDIPFFSTPLPLSSLPFSKPQARLVDAFLTEHSVAYTVARTAALHFLEMDKQPGLRCPPVPGSVLPMNSPAPEAVKQYTMRLKAFQGAVENLGAVPLLIVEPNFYYAWQDRDKRKLSAGLDACLTPEGIHQSLLAARSATQSLMRATRPVLDPTEAFAGNTKLLEDQLHLTQEGGTFFAGTVAEFLNPLLKARTTRKSGGLR